MKHHFVMLWLNVTFALAVFDFVIYIYCEDHSTVIMAE